MLRTVECPWHRPGTDVWSVWGLTAPALSEGRGGGWDLEKVAAGSQCASSARSRILSFDSMSSFELLKGLIHSIHWKDLPWGKKHASHF